MKSRILYFSVIMILALLATPVNARVGKVNHSFNLNLSQKDTSQVKGVVTSAVSENVSADLVLADPELIFFPKKISQKDLLIIIRKNNESPPSLTYTISAGSKTISGEFKGNKTEMRAYINLVDELKDLSGLEKITVVIKNSKGVIITTTDIPLVTLD